MNVEVSSGQNRTIQERPDSIWRITWEVNLYLALALGIAVLGLIPLISRSVLQQNDGATELVYLVGNSPHREDKVIAWEKAQPGVDKFACERRGEELWARWSYHGSTPTNAINGTPIAMRKFGYELSGMRGMRYVPIKHDEFDQVKHVLTDPIILATSLLSTQLGLGFIGWWRIRASARKGKPLPALFAGPVGRSLRYGILAGLGLFAFGWMFSMGVKSVLGHFPPSPWDATKAMPSVTRVMLLIFGGFGAPIAEEIFFRGYVFGVFKRSGFIATGIIISAAMFAMAHFSDIYNIPAIFVFGVTMAWVYHRTGSLAASMTAHAINNCFAILLLVLG